LKKDFTYIDWSAACRFPSNGYHCAVRSGVTENQAVELAFRYWNLSVFLFLFLNAVLPVKDKVLLIFPIASVVAADLPEL
jgi:hypothetical protein